MLVEGRLQMALSWRPFLFGAGVISVPAAEWPLEKNPTRARSGWESVIKMLEKQTESQRACEIQLHLKHGGQSRCLDH